MQFALSYQANFETLLNDAQKGFELGILAESDQPPIPTILPEPQAFEEISGHQIVDGGEPEVNRHSLDVFGPPRALLAVPKAPLENTTAIRGSLHSGPDNGSTGHLPDSVGPTFMDHLNAMGQRIQAAQDSGYGGSETNTPAVPMAGTTSVDDTHQLSAHASQSHTPRNSQVYMKDLEEVPPAYPKEWPGQITDELT